MYRFVDHTAELEVEIEAESAEGVLAEALRAFVDLVGTGEGEIVERRLVVAAADRKHSCRENGGGEAADHGAAPRG